MTARIFSRRKSPFLFGSSFLVLAILFSCFLWEARSETKYWINPTTGYWYQGSNWSGGTAPQLNDEVRIGNGGTAQIVGPPTTFPLLSDVVVGDGGDGNLIITDTSNDYARLISNRTYVGDSGATGTVILNRSNALWTSSQYYVGNTGNGTASVSGGAKVGVSAAQATFIGYASFAVGTVSVSGVGSTWGNLSDSSMIHVGESGKGTLNVSDGGSALSALITVGRYAESEGVVDISGTGSTIQSSSLLQIAEYGTGSLKVSNGGILQSAHSLIGSRENSSGLVLITGTGSKWTNSSEIYVGEIGDGSLEVEAGGNVRADSIGLGSAVNAIGKIEISGLASKVEATGTIAVGGSGTGVLTISENGDAKAYRILLASGVGSSGTLNIGDYDSTSTAGAITSNTVEFGRGTAIVNFNQSDSMVFTSVITGNGKVEQRGTGTTTFAVNQSYTGQTIVSKGTLLINGGLTSGNEVLVDEQGTLGGTGAISGATSISGRLSPGSNGTGKLTFENSLIVDDFAEVLMEIGGIGQGTYDQLLVNGSISVSESAVLRVQLVNGYTPTLGSTYLLFTGSTAIWSSSEIELPELSAGLLWDVSQLDSLGKLGVVPEPSATALVLFTLAIYGFGFGRKKRFSYGLNIPNLLLAFLVA